jgi:hypothetical protein
MAIVFAISTIATYMLLCVYPAAALQRVKLGAFERYGEVLSGAFIALIGVLDLASDLTSYLARIIRELCTFHIGRVGGKSFKDATLGDCAMTALPD